MKTLAERFFPKVERIPFSTCWLWNAAVNKEGYGEIKAEQGNKKYKAHRVAYELYKGPIPDGLVIDHICRNTSCVNPDHLRAITKVENTMIGFGYMAKLARRDCCNHGHPFTAENTISKNGKRRKCRTCKNLNEMNRKRMIRAKTKIARDTVIAVTHSGT
jgi:hypothetical protein